MNKENMAVSAYFQPILVCIKRKRRDEMKQAR